MTCVGHPDQAVAQGTSATLLGTVTDSSQAVMPSVEITVRNVGTGLTRSALTDEQGRYIVQELEIGTYEVQGSLAGFQTVLHRGIAATVGSRIVVDIVLPVGQVSETVA